MDFLDLCERRYSLRAYDPDKKVPREAIERCLEAARLAPSACNSQPWTFHVVDDDELRKEITKKAFSGVYSMNAFAAGAPVLIVVVTEKSKYAASLGGSFRGTKYALLDIGIAVEHLVLQAAEEGLGTCWIGWFNEKAVKKILGLPRTAKLDIVISMGYPPEGVEPRDKKRRDINDVRTYVDKRVTRS